MVITFFSNYLNHHQLPFCIEMSKILGENFKFIATTNVSEWRKKLGYVDMNTKYNFVVRAYEDDKEAYKLALESDVVIIGSAPQKYIKDRLKQKKLTFRYSERLFKSFKNFFRCLPSIVKFRLFENNNVFLLCSSAYSAYDFNKLGLYKNKTFKWGYFPEIKKYDDIDKLINNKEDGSILWVARFIKWKHPEIVVEIAKRLKKDNIKFQINMIGTGDMDLTIKQLIEENNLEDVVHLLGAMSPEQVRNHMEKNKIFLFTSDRNEGWGAVLNESMNSACAVIASHKIGSVPFLINNKKNGLIYEDGNLDDLYSKIKLLLYDKKLYKKLGIEAYNTMINLWNPKVAAERIIKLSKSLINDTSIITYNDGPCNKAEILTDNWYTRKELVSYENNKQNKK